MKNEIVKKTESQPLALADMSVPQLGEAFKLLDQTRQRHEHASGICATLQGLVLLEVKRKAGHGNFGTWLKEYFPKSQDTAGRFMRIAQDFLTQAPKLKFRSSAEFENAVVLLKQDLGKTLEQLEAAKLDLKHPVVEAAAAYAKGRGFTQLWLDLGPAQHGGQYHPRRQLTAEQAHAEAVAKFREEVNAVFDGVARLSDGRWKVLEDVEVRNALSLLKNLADPMREWLATPSEKRRVPNAVKLLTEGKDS